MRSPKSIPKLAGGVLGPDDAIDRLWDLAVKSGERVIPSQGAPLLHSKIPQAAFWGTCLYFLNVSDPGPGF
ncbi:hypothetical protein chiPu_0027166 [Chiloscyllium punctatum]|uniref:Uncharacterized protein n=1 Tax=Chiloscyllium punctatum TaxID=137246 RepID=A0A401TJX2_CHIPU|nr:hypothetical protein [Chiloscyllium punctatum]